MGVVINSGDKPWYTSALGITVIGTTKTYKTWDDMMKESYPGKLAWVIDATGDPTVDNGSALYAWRERQGWIKLYETEMMDQPGTGGGLSNFVGWVATPEQLELLHPVGVDGMFAIVGTTDSIWVWDGDTCSWVDSGEHNVVVNNQWTAIEGKPDYFPSNTTLVIDLTTNKTLDQIIVDLQNVNWDQIQNRPDFEGQFSAINTSITTINNKLTALHPVAYSGSYTVLSDKPDLSRYALTSHVHSWTDITSDVPEFADKEHQHEWVDILNPPNFSLNGHSHSWSDLISGVPSTFTPSPHNHTITEVTNLQQTINTINASFSTKITKPADITTGQMLVKGAGDDYIGMDIPEGADISGLEARVSTLETTVGVVDSLASDILGILEG